MGDIEEPLKVPCDHRHSVILVSLGVKQCVVCDEEIPLSGVPRQLSSRPSLDVGA